MYIKEWPAQRVYKSLAAGCIRNTEKRRERSRNAARCRRGKETEVFVDLSRCLPLPEKTTAALDKASIMRLALTHLKIRAFLDSVPTCSRDQKKEGALIEGCSFLKALHGFLLVLSGNGEIVFISENVTGFLGLQQLELLGQSIYDYVHPCDQEELKENLHGKHHGVQVEFFLRLKYTGSCKGRIVHVKSASFMVMHCHGEKIADTKQSFMVVACQPIAETHDPEVETSGFDFLTRHSPDMAFTYVDSSGDGQVLAEGPMLSASEIDVLHYEQSSLLGQSFYNYIHLFDVKLLEKNFRTYD
ncbi:unnamed protein product [Darwinula stevensoni]|uniref:Uncharacterized protein n=1 Tax=Darwinula stevensoni TaxID=69355 RepID=A0A7R8WZJ9_9CRUS|nr:unnamed protein product [Darwinula stevensoni]CAG0880657.1 unnamed protein product [Darwinula stevensoni]